MRKRLTMNIDNGAMTLATHILVLVTGMLVLGGYTLLLRLLWLGLAKFVTTVLKQSRVLLMWVYMVSALTFAIVLLLGERQLTSTPYDLWQGDIPTSLMVGAIGMYSFAFLINWEQQHDLRRPLRSENSNLS